MDEHYDHEGAASALEQLASVHETEEDRRLASVGNSPEWANTMSVRGFDKPQLWRLVTAGPGVTLEEECVFTLKGIISSVNFPPILEKPSTGTKQYKFMRQSLMLTGIGSPTFELAVKAVGDIYNIFYREFPEGRLERWEAAQHSKYTGLDISNRYFTPKRDAPNMIHIPFGTAIDPRGILETMVKEGYVHGEENEVEYYIQQTNQGHMKFAKANPQIFRVGDIVEAQVSFIVVPLKKQRYKMTMVLRAVAMLNGSFSQDANKKRANVRERPVLDIRPVLKRRVGYATTEQDGKKARMEVDEN